MFHADAIANFMISLEVMWKGMLGIFVVMMIIMAIVFILSRITQKKTSQSTPNE